MLHQTVETVTLQTSAMMTGEDALLFTVIGITGIVLFISAITLSFSEGHLVISTVLGILSIALITAASIIPISVLQKPHTQTENEIYDKYGINTKDIQTIGGKRTDILAEINADSREDNIYGPYLYTYSNTEELTVTTINLYAVKTDTNQLSFAYTNPKTNELEKLTNINDITETDNNTTELSEKQ